MVRKLFCVVTIDNQPLLRVAQALRNNQILQEDLEAAIKEAGQPDQEAA